MSNFASGILRATAKSGSAEGVMPTRESNGLRSPAAHLESVDWSHIDVDIVAASTSAIQETAHARKEEPMATISAPMLEEAVAISCAVEVFLATALLHREQPQREDFTIQEIVNRAARENLTGAVRPGIQVHASQHCVANKAPNPLKLRMLFATGKHTRRLSLPSDIGHPGRTGKIFPDEADVPESYRAVLAWARDRFDEALDSPDFWAKDSVERVRQLRSDDLLSIGYEPAHPKQEQKQNPLQELLDAKGIGIEMARGIDLDEHLRQVREGWE